MLQIALLIIGIAGLAKKRIKVTSKREIVGTPVVLLSCFYLFIAVAMFIFRFGLIDVFYILGAIAVVTLAVVIFAKGRPIIEVK